MKVLAAASVLLASCSATTVGSTDPGAQRTQISAPRNAFADQIDPFIVAEMAKRQIAGMAVAVVSNGRVRYAKGYGFADIERGIRVEKNTPFLIASQTKMFTAIGTMLLVQDGKVKLDAPVGQYVDDLPAHWRRATIRQLLGHTSGINSFTTHETPPCGRTVNEADYTQQHVIAEVACLPLDFEPGTDWSYGDTNYFVLGLLIERVSGLTYEQYLKKRILGPLGMHSTRLMGAIGVNDGRAVGYRWDGKAFVRGPALNPTVEGPGGGLVSTVFDLARFDAALAHDRLLPQSVLRSMWTPMGIGTAKYGMGFGVRPIDGHAQVGHTGGGPAASTSFARFIDEGMTVVVLTNTAQPPSTIQEIVGGIAKRVRNANRLIAKE